ncbi:uncharacterized protein LOC130944387 [Arachis stenosperma]|uniref:uncharacterized protein LOC130944387 n=1 Tax=Arachis stenosperma TaxID=217475 RepID=UPI0025AC4552|nr:uncharacterized protein LOC130944387 [Arachis stenosperma]
MLGDDDMRVIFHSQARFSDLGALELFARMVDVEGSSRGSAPNMPTGVIEGTSTAIPIGQPATPLVLTPSFAADLPVPGDDLGDGRSFGQLAAAIGYAPVVDGAPAFMEVRERDPFAEAIGDDGLDSEPPIIGDESDGEEDTAVAGGAQTHGSSGTQQYPRHFTTLDLEAMNQAANVDQHHHVIHGERPSAEERLLESQKVQWTTHVSSNRDIDGSQAARLPCHMCLDYIVVMADASVSVKVLQNAVSSKFGFKPSYRKVWMGKQKEITQIYGDWEESYNHIPRWIIGV